MIGKTLGHYRIGEQLGRGGMGEVYAADDLNLERKVALKFLPDAFTGDPERMARFEREAKLLASLNHPNIAAIYGLEQAEGKRFIVMELVEGETLQDRIVGATGRSPLQTDEALAIAKQIAEGLEAAHEKGVIHRDLKPANVMITEGDKVKILDFGLAKALSDETQSVDSSKSPTITEAMTRPGIILGTAAYMSPEQAKGKSVDRRADIWAFGCIVYECLTGKRPFEGETNTETLASILRSEPDWQALPATTPPNIRFVLRRCLERDLNRRFRDAADVRIEIEESFTAPPSFEPVRTRTSRALIASLMVICLVVGGGLAYLLYKSIGTSEHLAQPTFSHITAPAGTISAFHKGFALSPDGQTLVFSARTADGRQQIWKRRLDDPHAQPISGTDEGERPFWSPDGRQIAYFVPGELRRAPLEGGQVQTICAVTGRLLKSTWGDNNEILFAASRGFFTIFHVSADGGTPKEVSGLGKGNVYNPQWLPGSRFFLYGRSVENRSDQICAASLEGKLEPKEVAQLEIHVNEAGSGFFFSLPGNLFFNRAGALFVQQFDSKSLSITGQAVAIAGLAGSPGNWFTLSASHDKVAMLARESTGDTSNPGDPLARLKWINRKGETVGELGQPGRYWNLRLSPDGSRAAVNPDINVWILDSSNRRTRIPSRHSIDFVPLWSPDGTQIASYSGQSTILKSSRQGEDEIELPNSYELAPMDWSRDGRHLLLLSEATRGSNSSDIWVYDFKEKSARPWLQTKFDEKQARFSPDGKWVAYSSNANGPMEIYVRPFKGEGDAILVSSVGGVHPIWRADGRELFYLSPKDELMVVSVLNSGTNIKFGEPQRLFKVEVNDIAITLASPYDVAPDGQRFLINIPEPPEPLLFIQGIDKLLKRGQ